MKDRKQKSRLPILAAGGIVLRNGHDLTPQFAIVQSHKLESWGLPKGKLAAGEEVVVAARREVLEETGHHVTIHEFLGTLVYETSRRTKVVQFWRMEAVGERAFDLKGDVRAVQWLPLEAAIDRLTHLRERVFLEQVGPVVLRMAGHSAGPVLFRRQGAGTIVVPVLPLAPAADAPLRDDAAGALAERPDPGPFERFFASDAPCADVLAPAGVHQPKQGGQARETEAAGGRLDEEQLAGKSLGGKTLMKKTLGWFRHAGLLHRHPLDSERDG
jgi:8-oxo-dGTP diphosphatase